MPTTRPPFPLVWDNTMRSTFVACPRKFELEFLHHWKPQQQSIHLHAGAAWAHALEVARRSYYCENLSSEDSIAAGTTALITAYGDFPADPASPKSLNRLCEAFVYYWQAFPFDRDPAQPYVGATGPMIEFSFALPFDTGSDPLLHPESGEPIIYAGRADMIATYAGAVSVYDDKTTSSLGASWAGQWDMRSQFTGYCWGASTYAIPVTQVIVRGICILKTKIDHAQAITHRSAFRIDRWHAQVKRDIRRAIECWREGYFDYNEADTCSTYSGCVFKQPCMSPEPQPWLETAFVRRIWNPVTRTEETLE